MTLLRLEIWEIYDDLLRNDHTYALIEAPASVPHLDLSSEPIKPQLKARH